MPSPVWCDLGQIRSVKSDRTEREVGNHRRQKSRHVNDGPGVIGWGVKSAAGVRVDLHPDPGVIEGELLPELRNPLMVQVESVAHRVMPWVNDLGQYLRVTPRADPQYLALSATFAASTHHGEGLLEERLGEPVQRQRLPPFTALGRNSSFSPSTIPASCTETLPDSSTPCSLNKDRRCTFWVMPNALIACSSTA